LPSEIGYLHNLQFAYLYDNQLSGSIPTEIGGFGANTVSLHFYNNRFNGMLPSELGLVTGMTELQLANNTFEGRVPSEFGLLTNAYILYLSHNRDLNGTLPTELEQLTNIAGFDISDTSITGDVPSLLQDVQSSLSFERYYFNCSKHYPCPEDKPNPGTNAQYAKVPDEGDNGF